MIVKTYPLGSLQTNCYLAIDENTNKAAIIDPGAQASYLIKEIENLGIEIDVILLTHCHFDHNGAVAELKEKYNVDVYLNKAEEEFMESDNTGIFGKLPKIYKYLEEGQEIKVGDLTFKVTFTPGHSKGGTCFIVADSVFTGDTLFKGRVGKWIFPTGDLNLLKKSIINLIENQNENIRIHPGHYESSTIGEEKRNNSFYNEWKSIRKS